MSGGRKGPWWLFPLTFAVAATVAVGRPQSRLTVAEDIGIAHFHRRPSEAAPTELSPNRRDVAVWVERGLPKKNLVEDNLRVYSMAALLKFARDTHHTRVPSPLVNLRESTYKEGPIISSIHWLPNSRGLVFLLRNAHGEENLAFISLKNSKLHILSLRSQDVTAFDVRDLTHYVYTVLTPGGDSSPASGHKWVAWDSTGQSLMNILFPKAAEESIIGDTGGVRLRSVLWAAMGGHPHVILSRRSRRPIILYPRRHSLALSPGEQIVATEVPVRNVPENWVWKFRAADTNSPYRIHVGRQNLNGIYGGLALITEYALIDLQDGQVQPVAGAPTGFASGYWVGGGATWSQDGKSLILPNTYLQQRHRTSVGDGPCAAVFQRQTGGIRCIDVLEPEFTKTGGPVKGFFFIDSIHFVGSSSTKVVMRIRDWPSSSSQMKELVLNENTSGKWNVGSRILIPGIRRKLVRVYIRQGLNRPPVLVAARPGDKDGRVIWNPNPQLKGIALGHATVYRWTDRDGRRWVGGLYWPLNYVSGRRYALVIQTHGFHKDEFRSSGIYPTAFAARVLAAAGMFVLQSPVCPIYGSPEEGRCNVEGFEAAVHQLESQGLISPDRIGIIGFSATVYHVLMALEAGGRRFAAASVTDGVDYGYWQYLESLDVGQNEVSNEANAVIGAKPFGVGLRLWMERSPEFNMQEVHTPLLVVGLGRPSLLFMWEPYAALRYLNRPVDLLLLNSDEHILTNPAVRAESQGSSVDWFRFWLQGYESRNPRLKGMYQRWEKLCSLEKVENPQRRTLCVTGKPR